MRMVPRAIAAVLIAWTAGSTGRAQSAQRAPVILPCGDILGFQILLDRQGFSPGEIDGKRGTNLSHALAALQAARGIPTTGEPDCDTWHALGGDRAGDLIATYTVTADDVNGPFEGKIPRDLLEQAKLPSLGYRSADERLAEKFHTSIAVLRQLNPGVALASGVEIRVPGIKPFDPAAKPAPDPAAGEIVVVVSKVDSAVRAIRSDGSIALFAPVTTGSQHDPLPHGDWNVTTASWLPAFHYNPDLFWDAKPEHTKATIKPGPNNPVGVVWIGLTLEHYGLHGTPEPGRIGYTESHGCVRLTNWDAARLASLVKPGTLVQFR